MFRNGHIFAKQRRRETITAATRGRLTAASERAFVSWGDGESNLVLLIDHLKLNCGDIRVKSAT